MSLALAADPCCIDKAELLPFKLHDFIDGIAGGAGDGRNDGAGGSGEGVEECGLAYVGTADDGDGGFIWLVIAMGAEEGMAVFVQSLCLIVCVGAIFAGYERSTFGDFILFGGKVFGFLR